MFNAAYRLVLSLVLVATSITIVSADPPAATSQRWPDQNVQQLELDLAKYLCDKKFVGQFTIDGKPGITKVEEYEISDCEKIDAPGKYRLTARIKYGEVDTQLPLELTILFAGQTPVITLDSFWIPGMGTFDARVLIRRGHYAGTWKHDETGGHLFGEIVPIKTEK